MLPELQGIVLSALWGLRWAMKIIGKGEMKWLDGTQLHAKFHVTLIYLNPFIHPKTVGNSWGRLVEWVIGGPFRFEVSEGPFTNSTQEKNFFFNKKTKKNSNKKLLQIQNGEGHARI